MSNVTRREYRSLCGRMALALPLLALFLVYAPGAWAANSIGINFIGGGNNGTTSLLSTDTAGVVPQTYWNNAGYNGNMGEGYAYTDNTGFNTGAYSYGFFNGGTWNVLAGTSNGDYKMMSGYLNESPNNTGGIGLHGIP